VAAGVTFVCLALLSISAYIPIWVIDVCLESTSWGLFMITEVC